MGDQPGAARAQDHDQDHDQDPDVRQELDHMEGVDRCVFCGEVIPEGRHVCPRCMAGEMEAIRDI